MAEALVFAVLLKIGSVLGEEVMKAGISKVLSKASELRIRNIRGNISHVQTEFRVMRAFLRKANVRVANNETFETLLGELREVANNVEDIIDEYTYLIRQIEGTSNCLIEHFCYMKKLTSFNEINTRLSEVKIKLVNLKKMREQYGIAIPDLGRSSNNASDAYRRPNLSAYSNAVIEDEIVGNMEERAKLTQWLREKDPRRVIISISGMGGLGKTTLVNSIYKREEIKRNFDCCACVSVSQSFQIKDLFKSIIKQVLESGKDAPAVIDGMELLDLVHWLQCYLQSRSYLIVLDDIWKEDAWLFLSPAFPDNKYGSRIVITTRMNDVALLADEDIRLSTLSDDESWHLFCTKAFQKLGENKCPTHLETWAKKILHKCQGLPLAIVAIGSLVSSRERTKKEWGIFYGQLSWRLSNNSELGWVAEIVLNLSYDNLPTYLKNCFLYCSLFPPDFLIQRKWIIRLWIAEGFVEGRGTETTLEEVAETYLVELAHSSLLQVVDRNVNGRPKRFQIHDFVRDICIIRSKIELFGIPCNEQCLRFEDKKSRRFYIHNKCENLQLDGGLSNIRSFLLFNNSFPSSQIEFALSNFKLMRVLCLRFSRIESLPDVVFQLFNLSYLDLSYTKIKMISKSLGRLKLLQTLDLRFTLVKKLPHEITKLTNLRHLFVVSYRDYQERIFECFSGVPIPAEICGLRNLQTLRTIEANEELVSQLGRLAMMNNIVLTKIKRSYISDLWFSISKMPRLTNLGIVACDKDEVLNFEKFIPLSCDEDEVLNIENLDPLSRDEDEGLNVENIPLSCDEDEVLNPLSFQLEKLYLRGKLEGGVIPSIFSSFGNIRDLRMGWSGLRVDPLSSFSHMTNLTNLHLYKVYEGQVLTFCSGWFPKLKNLYLADLLYLTDINFEKGTTPSILHLELIGLMSLTKVPEGVQYLCSLQEMFIRDMPVEFVGNLRGDEGQAIVRHIAAVKMYK